MSALSPDVVELLRVIERGEDLRMSAKRRAKHLADVRRELVSRGLVRYSETKVAGGVWSSWQLTKKGLRAAEAGQTPGGGGRG